MTRAVDVVIVVVNFERPSSSVRIARALSSAVRSAGLSAIAYVADNSGDVQAHIGLDCHLRVVSFDNPGYAAAVNAIMDSTSSQHALVCTHEVDLKDGDIGRLLGLLEASREVAAVGPALCWPDGRKTLGIATSLAGVRHVLGQGGEHTGRSAAYVDGAFWALSREAWRSVGPLREDFFLYWEEVEWQARARRRGWEIRVDPTVEVATSASVHPDAVYYVIRNGLVFLFSYRRGLALFLFALRGVILGSLIDFRSYCLRKSVAERVVVRERLRLRWLGIWHALIGRCGPRGTGR